MEIERLTIALGWFSMVWFVSAAFLVIVAQALLPHAWKAIRAHPPLGPEWARTLWYRRAQLYGWLMALAVALGALAALLYLFTG